MLPLVGRLWLVIFRGSDGSSTETSSARLAARALSLRGRGGAERGGARTCELMTRSGGNC